jgi:hypothetical protein
MNATIHSQRRAPRGYTYDPCPGCGETKGQPRPRDGVCATCTHAIAWAKAERDKMANRADAESRVVPVAFPPCSHWLPYLPEKGKSGSPIQQAYHAIVRLVTEDATSVQLDVARNQLTDCSRGIDRLIPPHQGGYHGSDWSPYKLDDYRMIDAQLAQPLSTLYDAIRQGLEAAYRDGVQYGRSLLFQLNDGSLSTDDFAKRLKPYDTASNS